MIPISGTIASSVKLQTLNNSWQQKKDSGNVLSKEEQNERANWTQEEWLKHDIEEQAAQNREANKNTAIDNKIASGGTLTPEEEQYLEQNNPTALQKYKQIQEEKKAYEEKLKKCRTKDEVERVKTETMGAYLSSIKKIEHNPHIPMGEKLAKAQEMMAKTKNALEVERKFKQSPEYDKLPTEAEQAQERSEERNQTSEQIQAKREAIAETSEVYESVAATESTLSSETSKDATQNTESGEDSSKDTTKNKHKKEPSNDLDLLKDIQETYQRIELNIKLENTDNTNVKTESEKKVGRKIDIIA